MANETTIPRETHRRMFDLRCKSKRGGYLSPEEFDFLQDCYRKWPIEYQALQQAVFEETKPFGSQADASADPTARVAPSRKAT
jgi:hypothetical protein